MPKNAKPTHGGRRPGAGQPKSPDPRLPFGLRLRADPAARIRHEAERRSIASSRPVSPADVIEDFAATLPAPPGPQH
jgi:hypothetical protein